MQVSAKAMVWIGSVAMAGCIFVIPEDAIPGAEVREAVDSVRFDAGLGDLTLVVPAGDIDVEIGSTPGLDAHMRWRGDLGDGPSMTIDTVGDASTYTWTCPSPARDCTMDLVVQVPADLLSLTVDVAAGSVTTVDLAAVVDVDVDAGDIYIVGHEGELSASTNAGSIEGTALCSATVDASIDAGDLELEFCDRPVAVTTRVNTGSIEMELPSGDYDLQLDTNLGSITVLKGIVDDAAADVSIQADVDLGDVTLRSF